MPESSSPSTAPGSIPKTSPIPPGEMPASLKALNVLPYGMGTFADFDRQKSFTTLHFKHKGGDQDAVLTWIGAVLDELTAAGMPASARIEIELTPDPARSTPTRPKLRGHLKVPVDLK